LATASLQRLTRTLGALAPAVEGIERGLPLWQRLEHCWLRLGGPVARAGEAELADARLFIDALAQHDDAEQLVGQGMAQLTQALYGSSPPAPDAVEIMTVHAAKGLEWDVVILPSLGRRTAHDSDPLLHWIELPRAHTGSDLLLAPIRAEEREPPASLGAYIKLLRRERARLERVRLLYVAATRARRSLHLLGGIDARSAQTAPAPARGSLLALLWPAIGAEFLAAAGPADAERNAAGALAAYASPPLLRLPADWRLPPPPPSVPVRRLQLSLRAPEEQPEYSWVGLTARAIGTIVHAELHRLATLPALPAEGAPELLAKDYAAWLADLGVAAAERADAGARIVAALRNTLSDPRGRWLLRSDQREAQAEIRLSGIYEGRVINIVLDRMFVDEHSRRWIVDFKTSTHEGGAVALFLQAELQRYRPQLLRYRALARELGPEPVHAALYFPLLGEFCELPP